MCGSAISNYLTPSNTTIVTVKDFENIPIYVNGVQNIYLKDVATVEDGGDITQGYALVNGKRSVYLPITKAAEASTWEVVQNLKKAIPRFQAQLPEDVKLSYVFDQSTYVINAVKNLLSEGAIGAILTGLMVLLFLGDLRGAAIVILTIPICVISGVLLLNLFHQTVNIMTLSGLSLAIGILVDESTVTIENIHQHLAVGQAQIAGDLGCVPRDRLFQAVDPVLYPGRVCTGIVDGRDSGLAVPATIAGYRIFDDHFLPDGADLCAGNGQLDDEGAP